MKKAAKFVRYLPSHLNGALYELSHRIRVGDRTTNYVNVLTFELDKIYREKVTMAYAANDRQHFLSITPIPRSQVEGISQEACLNKIGFKLESDTNNNNTNKKETDYDYIRKTTPKTARKAIQRSRTSNRGKTETSFRGTRNRQRKKGNHL